MFYPVGWKVYIWPNFHFVLIAYFLGLYLLFFLFFLFFPHFFSFLVYISWLFCLNFLFSPYLALSYIIVPHTNVGLGGVTSLLRRRMETSISFLPYVRFSPNLQKMKVKSKINEKGLVLRFIRPRLLGVLTSQSYDDIYIYIYIYLDIHILLSYC